MAKKQEKSPSEKPTGHVTDMSMSRTKGTRTIVMKWKVPTSLTKAGTKKRTTSLDEKFTLKDDKGKVIAYRFTHNTNERDTSYSINLASFEPTTTNYADNAIGSMFSGAFPGTSTRVTRSSFYPVTSTKLASVVGSVRCCNTYGKATYRNKTYTFGVPDKPTISALTQTEEEGHIQFTITAFDDGGSKKERYDTQYQIVVYDDRVKKNTTDTTSSFTEAKKEWTTQLDVTDRQQLTYDQYVKVSVKARSRGYAGDSAWTAPKTLVVSYPAATTFAGNPVVSGVSGNPTATDKVTIPIKTNTSTNHPVTGVRLQKLVNVTYDKVNRIPGTADWQDTGMVDDGHCTALAIGVSEVLPEAGRHTWVRVKSWNQFEDMFYRYSAPIMLKDLEANLPTAEDDDVAILAIEPDDGGTSIALTLGWNADGEDDSTGTEVSWSTNENAWRSTSGPETHQFTWSDGQLVWPPVGEALTPGQTRITYLDSAVIHVDGLTEGTLYHFRARRYMEGEDVTTYGEYSETAGSMPVSSPGSVGITCAQYITSGSDLSVAWNYDSAAAQTMWQVITGEVTEVTETTHSGSEDVTGTEVTHYRITGDAAIVASGTDSNGACVIQWSRLAEFIGDDGTIPLAVTMGTGGVPTTSDATIVRVVEPPDLTLTVPETLTAQPLQIGLSSATMPDVTIVVRADVAPPGGSTPFGSYDQQEGDAVWSAAIRPEWVAGTGANTVTVTVPTTRDIHDNGTYVITARATDPETGISGEDVTATFAVAWARHAPELPDDMSITPYDEVDDEGTRRRGCRIQLAPATGAIDTDTYDVYRQTPDGTYAIATGMPTDALIDDPYAPYGGSEKGYVVALWTVDGDVEWDEYGYELPGRDLRIDFDNEYVELPWNVSLSDSYTKDFEARRKLDGSIDGYWNDGAERRASLSTDLMRIKEQDKAAAVRRLAQHSGPCFVRTPDGCAYMASVTVNSIGGARRDFALAVSLDATEIDLTPDYMALTVGTDEQGG